jgi:MoxR-like ATPase
MSKYNVAWTKLDPGREGWWSPPQWRGVLEIASKYDGQDVYSPTSPIYNDLNQAFPNDTWLGRGASFHPVFRDYLHPWKYTKTLEVDNHILRLTQLAKNLLTGSVSEIDIFLQMFREYEESGEKPFRILAAAFLDAKRPLSLSEIFLGIMQGFRPGVDNLEEALQEADSVPATSIDTNDKRRLKFMLGLLERIGALVHWDESWAAWNKALLQRIASASTPTLSTSGTLNIGQLPENAASDMALAKLRYNLELIRRYAAALLAKRFVIFTGLTGSGKTKLAQAFAKWIAPSKQQYEIVAVGANWTSKEHILGYPDALNPAKYERAQALDVILRAEKEPNVPFFLILDEMNLSHVERYFADLLSALETGEKLPLYSEEEAREGVPPYLERLPSNLFIVGTVNVDETTYMFSPKVLDRANVIEFRVEFDEMTSFLDDPQTADLEMLSRLGAEFSEAFVSEAKSEAVLEYADKQQLERELLLLFEVLKECGAEFGFRTAHEITRFVCFHKKLTSSGWEFKAAMDAQILQKLLPRLQGSRKKLEPVLRTLRIFCYQEHHYSSAGEIVTSEGENLREEIKKSIQLPPENDPLDLPVENAYYPLSYKKIIRMLKSLEQGFTSFAEA